MRVGHVGQCSPCDSSPRGATVRVRYATKHRMSSSKGICGEEARVSMAAPLTEAAIEQVRDLISTGQLSSGERLPPEAELAELLGTSRNTVREAVRALVTARVLDVRRGDGTFVTSLRPELLLEGIGAAVELMQEGFSLELIAVRRILEPAATSLAADRIDDATLAELGGCLDRMREARSEAERIEHDADFHRLVAA